MGSVSTALYLSPHLDDVALSCGGQIHHLTGRGFEVTVVTVFARDEPGPPYSPFVEKLHQGFDMEQEVVARRRSEDKDACRVLGARATHWDETEAIYRRKRDQGSHLYPKFRHLFRGIRGPDRDLVGRLRTRFSSLPKADTVLAPLGVGRHVDHMLVRQAAEEHFGKSRLTYYDDYPYVELWAWARFRAARPRRHWTSRAFPLEKRDVEARIDAIAAYRSQLALLFGSRRDLEQRIRGYVEQSGGERLWRRASADATPWGRGEELLCPTQDIS